MKVINSCQELAKLAKDFFKQNKELKESDFAITNKFIKDFRKESNLPKLLVPKIAGFCNPITGKIFKISKVKKIKEEK